ncbi:MAG: TIGR04086 family membrane protein [Clostridia bacterium]|nr:TIGR04086 family membrane protein [Clostridia bacterium]
MENIQSSNIVLSITKAAFFAITCSLLGVLIFALLLKFTPISESLISPVNQSIKVLSIFVGCLVLTKKQTAHIWFWGAILGLVYTVLSYIIFSILDGEFSFSISLLWDALFAMIVGLISGVFTKLITK